MPASPRTPPKCRASRSAARPGRATPATDADPAVLTALVEKAFNQRRKMLRRSLAGTVSAEQFESAGVDPEDRPERLSVEDFGRLANAVARPSS